LKHVQSSITKRNTVVVYLCYVLVRGTSVQTPSY